MRRQYPSPQKVVYASEQSAETGSPSKDPGLNVLLSTAVTPMLLTVL